MSKEKGYKCSFCGRSKEETNILIAGIEGHICENCIAQAQQIMDIEMPEMMGTVRKSFKGLLSDAPVKRGFGSPDMLPPE